jgi:hypothetical protein
MLHQRWLYVVIGLIGAVLILTGVTLWTPDTRLFSLVRILLPIIFAPLPVLWAEQKGLIPPRKAKPPNSLTGFLGEDRQNLTTLFSGQDTQKTSNSNADRTG